MFLILFIIFLSLSLLLVALGLFKPEHSELSLIGFFFIFILAMNIVLGGTIQYKTGENLTYSCLCCDEQEGGPIECYDNSTSLVMTSKVNYYEDWSGDGTFGHILGYWLAVLSVVGFIGVLASLRGNIKK